MLLENIYLSEYQPSNDGFQAFKCLSPQITFKKNQKLYGVSCGNTIERLF